MTSEEIPSFVEDFVRERSYLALFVVIDLLLGISCGSLNGIAMLYYKSKLRRGSPAASPGVDNINNSLYFTLSVFGLFVSCGALLHCLILLLTIYYTQSLLNVLLCVAYVLVIVSTYVSTIINITLAVVRTINIASPLRKVNTTATLLCIGLYGLGWCVVVGADLYYWNWMNDDPGELYFYCFINMSSTNGLLNILHKHGLVAMFILEHRSIFPFIIWGIPCVIPSFICFLCFIIQIISLWGRKRVGRDEINRRVTVTIILLTLVFIVCNTLSFTYCITMVLMEWKGYEVFLGLYVATSILPFLNTLLNPIILISRGHRLREFFESFVSQRTVAIRESARHHVTSTRDQLQLRMRNGTGEQV